MLVSHAVSGLYDRGVEERRGIGADVRDLASALRWLADGQRTAGGAGDAADSSSR